MTKVRAVNRLELTGEEVAFVKKAVKAQAESLEALTEWPDILPYTQSQVVKSHSDLLVKLDDLSKPVAVKTRAPRAKSVASVKPQNGASRDASA